jgi:hypothetical protein
MDLSTKGQRRSALKKFNSSLSFLMDCGTAHGTGRTVQGLKKIRFFGWDILTKLFFGLIGSKE